MVMLELSPTSKQSVFAAPLLSPSESSIVGLLNVKPVEPSMEKTWTGELRM